MPFLSRLSPRYTMNSSSPMNSLAQLIACAMPFGSPCVMYVNLTPNSLPSPRNSWTFSGITFPSMIPISVMPASRRSSMQYSMFGLFAIGMSCFGPVCVRGLSLVPYPPARTSPFISSSPPAPSSS